MTTQAIQGTALHPAWPLPLFLLRTAWADQPYDALTGYVGELAEGQLLEVVGEPVAMLDGVSPGAGPAGLLPGLVASLRRTGGTGPDKGAGSGGPHPAQEALSLLTAAAGDSASLPPVPPVRDDVADAGCGVLVRDPATREAVCVTVLVVEGEVARWRARGVQDCPVAPQPEGPAAALAELGRAVVEAAEMIECSAAAGATDVVEVHGHVTRLPAGLPSRVLELIDRVDRVESIVTAALARPGVGADAAVREPVLRRLVSALDAGRRAAVAAAGDAALRPR